MSLRYLKSHFILLATLAMPILIFIFSIGQYYGFYYDNHYFNLLALDLMEGFRPWLYLGSHYSIHSALYSWLVLPLFYIFGPADFSMELLSAFFHLATVVFCFKLGARLFNRHIGVISAFLAATAPIYLINVYTFPECSLIVLLNTASLYYFLAGFSEFSNKKIALSATLFSLSCFQAIYSVVLLPVFLIYAVFQINADVIASEAKQSPKIASSFAFGGFLAITFRSIRYLPVIVAAAYLIALIEAMYIGRPYRTLYYTALCLLAIGSIFVFHRLFQGIKRILSFASLFFIITATALLLLDLFVQLDMNFFDQRFGYYRDSLFAGGFGTARPPFIFRGAPLAILSRPLYLSVLSSSLAFTSLYTRVSLSLSEFYGSLLSYYRECFPLGINVFFIAGVTGLLSIALYRKYKRQPLGSGMIFALVWLFSITITFFNNNTLAGHLRRIYILPMPYFFASMGVYYAGKAVQRIFSRRRNIFTPAVVILTSFLLLRQLLFLKHNVYDKYKYDISRSNYFELFHGWPYGRTYKEVGNFLLKDAPLKQKGKFRSIFIYTIAGDTAHGICALFYNNIDWYTRNKIKILYDAKPISRAKYGSRAALAQYLQGLFSEYPDVQAIYFADFYDQEDNFSFFSKMHPQVRPYRIINDDDTLDYDCILYKFERGQWRGQLG